MTDGHMVTVTTSVGKGGGVGWRWVVAASFVGLEGAQPRCVDYRVRAVPYIGHGLDMHSAHDVEKQMLEGQIPEDDVPDFEAIPPEGIPRYVFESASQRRLLEKALRRVENPPPWQRPVEYQDETVALLRSRPRKRGRPPTWTVAEKLPLLKAMEEGYATGMKRADVAVANNVSESTIRNLQQWAVKHDPPLWVSYGPGRRGGHMTAEAEAMHQHLDDEKGSDDGQR